MVEYKVIESDTLEVFEAELNRWGQEGYVLGICEHVTSGSWWAIMEQVEEEI